MKKIKRAIILSVVLLCFASAAVITGGIMFTSQLNDITHINVTRLVTGFALLTTGVYVIKFGLALLVSSSAYKYVYKAIAVYNMRNVRDIAVKYHMSAEKVKVTIQNMFNKGIIASYSFDQTGTEIAEIAFSEQ